MPITATEFKSNLGMYLDMLNEQDVYISKNGTLIAKLIGIKNKKEKKNIEELKKLSGVLKTNYSIDDIREARVKGH